MYVRQNDLEAEFWDIRVAVSFVVVSDFLESLVVVCFSHIFVYFFRSFMYGLRGIKEVRLVLDGFDAFMWV